LPLHPVTSFDISCVTFACWAMRVLDIRHSSINSVFNV
jgi:hypothetical protein